MLTRARKRRMNADQEEQNPVDMISALPDDILCHILSFLPTKLAFATTILSKRWTSLSRSLTSLNFYYDGSLNGPMDQQALLRFIGFVDTVMLFPREQHQPIKNFVLKFPPLLFPKEVLDMVGEWVEVAKRHRVESLDIHTHWVTLLPNFFCCRTLVVLKLSRSCVDNVSSIDLPSLKSLQLSLVNFRNKDDFKKLLHGAPILNDLYVEEFKSEFPYSAGNKSLPKLVKLHIRNNTADEFQTIQMENLSKHISTPLFPNLIELSFTFPFFYGWHAVLQVLHQCPRLQSLIIKKEFVSTPYREYSESTPVPRCLSSHLRTCIISSVVSTKEDIDFAAYIMKNAGFLQAMTVCLSFLFPKQQHHNILEELLALPRISPACKISVLSNCKL